jgi:hypothetical protein
MSLTTTPEPTQIPVTVLTGILGAGKTTLLNGILSENHGQSRSACALGQILEMEPDFLSGEHTSVSLTSDTPTDTQRFNVWIGTVLAEHGQDLLRTTCLRVAMSSAAGRTVVQGRLGSCWTQHRPSRAATRLRGLRDRLTLFPRSRRCSAWLRLGFRQGCPTLPMGLAARITMTDWDGLHDGETEYQADTRRP